jgi:hypothetical protein
MPPTRSRRRRAGDPRAGRPVPAARRKDGWLVFAHQLPAHPSNARVKIWRRMQQIGAVALKNAVYVLPNSEQAREDFEWLRTEVIALGGQASIFRASSLSQVDERHIIRQLSASKLPARTPAAAPKSDLNPRDFKDRQWVTRPRPGVDRFSSAWLIRRFIDANAVFVFASSPEKYREAVPFDMYQSGGFKHEGDKCTFEVLTGRFGIRDAAVRIIGEIVHDLDLKEDRFKSPYARTIGALVEGLRASIVEDGKLLDQGMTLFEALYQSLQPAKGLRGGKPKIC